MTEYVFLLDDVLSLADWCFTHGTGKLRRLKRSAFSSAEVLITSMPETTEAQVLHANLHVGKCCAAHVDVMRPKIAVYCL